MLVEKRVLEVVVSKAGLTLRLCGSPAMLFAIQCKRSFTHTLKVYDIWNLLWLVDVHGRFLKTHVDLLTCTWGSTTNQ